MAKNAIIPEAINDFNMYKDGNKLIGITGEVSFADLSLTAYLHDVVVEIVEIQYVEEEILVCEQFQKEIAF